MNKKDYEVLLTVDVEDWFQVENFKQRIPFSSWASCQLRVEKSTHLLLDLLDRVNHELAGARSTRSACGGRRTDYIGPRKLRATFFVLGWIAKRLPLLVREITSRGHEVASHGYAHKLCTKCYREELIKDLADSKKLLEDTAGYRVYGYRAPSFAINERILRIIRSVGYLYDSSYNSFGLHGRYGALSLQEDANKGIAREVLERFFELPISNLSLRERVLPWGGGAYFRLLPLWVFKMGVASILKKDRAYVFYVHPWELDPEQPKVKGATAFSRFRHYTNLKKTESKLSAFMRYFDHCSFTSCHEYLQRQSRKGRISGPAAPKAGVKGRGQEKSHIIT